MKIKKTMFMKPKNKALARKISIESPTKFRESISKCKKGGLTLEEKRALVLAQNRARVQLKRKNLSGKERRQFQAISKVKLPPITKRKR